LGNLKMSNRFELFRKKMESDGLDEIVISSFEYLFTKLAEGESGKLTRQDIKKPDEKRIINYEDLPPGDEEGFDQLAIIKLNGGLGTSMGLEKAKSLLKVKDDYNFLDIIARQVLYLRKKSNHKIPLIFMNSFNTSADTIKYLSKYPELRINDLPLEFLQNKFPKIISDSLVPLNLDDDNLNWNPPGHGEIYMVMKQTGLLDLLLQKGYRYLFISNSDNLGAVADKRIMKYMKAAKIPFIMEVCQRNDMDKKGGHLAQDTQQRLILRESAHCPKEEIEEFEDINYFKYFNTNNLWLNLEALNEKLNSCNNFIQITPIMNPKIVNGIPVIQLETAMGSAINIFDDSKAIHVKRERFIPVKNTNELLSIRSNAYSIDERCLLKLADCRSQPPIITLDPRYYKNISDFERRFPCIPYLQNCTILSVSGDITFGMCLIFTGNVHLKSSDSTYLEQAIYQDATFTL
jgi:UTP--glucose-1-phosphate uridylyltransferase